MKEKSIWLTNNENNNITFPPLTSDISTKVLIIGGGITGILCAYELKQRNIDYILVEKEKIGLKTSKDTTAFVTVHHETLYQDLIKDKGLQIAKQYLELNIKALERYKVLSEKYDFDYAECPSTLFTNKKPRTILQEVQALNKLGYDSKIIRKLPIDINIKAGITINNQIAINPYKLIKQLSQELNIYENTYITKLNKNFAYTINNHKITFEKVIIATHYPFKNILGLYFLKLNQKRSYVYSIHSNINFNGLYCSIDDDGVYFRKYNNNIIIGGNDRFLKDQANNNLLSKIAKLNLGKVENYWSGQDCITLDGIPYIGKLNKFNSNYLVATGFNLWGFTWAMASSIILADIIQYNKEYAIVSPQRKIVKEELFNNIKTSIKGFISLKTPRCKHLGCKLNYNELEHTWECPCHGTRYDEQGKVIDGPAKKNIKL